MPKTKIRKRSTPAGSPWGKAVLIFVIILVSGLVLVGGVIGGIIWFKHHKSDKDDFADAPVTDPGDPPIPREEMTTVLPRSRGQDPLQLSPEFRNLLADLDTNEPGWRLADLEMARPFVPPERNGAIYVHHVVELIGNHSFDESDKLRILAAHETLGKDDRRYMISELAKIPSVVGQARKLSRFPEGRFRLVWTTDPIETQLNHLQIARKVLRVLYYDTLRLAGKNDVQQCLENVKAMIHVARYFRDETTALAQLVRVATLNYALSALENALAVKADASDDALASVQKLLEEDADRPDLYFLFRGERAGFHCAFTNRANGDVPNGKVTMTDNDHRVWLSLMTRLVRWSRTPPRQPDPVFAQIESDILSAPINVRKIFVAAGKIHVAEAKIHTRLRAAVAAIKCERFRLQHGAWPNDLGPDAPLDSWSSAPLKLAVRSQGIAIYSALNAPDAGGDFDKINESGEKTNVGFRLLDPGRRN